MNILIQKFGGTSVSSPENRELVVEKVSKAIESGYNPVVVVSAMGRIRQPYATDTFLSLISDDFKSKNPMAVDLLISCGEIISTVVVSDDLNKASINAVPISGGNAGILTDDNYRNASVLSVNPKNLIELLKQGKVPVVAGFQGQTEKGFITTLGRGASDLTAALLGAALKASEIQIFTDVDGIMTADPRIVQDAELIKEISYNEVFQFADQGAKVIHPRAVDVAMKANIPLVIKNTMSDCDGTVINSTGPRNTNNIITGITHLTNRVQIKIKQSDNGNLEAYDDIFEIIANNLISIDLISVFPNEKIFTIDKSDSTKFEQVMMDLNIKYSFIDNCSKIAVIGSRMRGVPGVMAKILKALTREKIEVLQTADSHTTIWCLVEDKNIKNAIIALHKQFMN